ncbi:hypothetical protein GGR55DRAFT_644755 [Xylaria sp. FL0064]|nr:hypothetical protein GGR55DRAFT_644755 [Xylaria sp. FL0064]
MDGLYVDTFGTLPIDDLSNTSAPSQSTSHEGDRPNSQSCGISGGLYDQRGNNNESSGINRSALELAVCRTRAARLSPLPSEKENGSHRAAPEQNKAAENEGEKLVEEPRIVDELCYCCRCHTSDCPCIYDYGANRPYRAMYDADFWDRVAAALALLLRELVIPKIRDGWHREGQPERYQVPEMMPEQQYTDLEVVGEEDFSCDEGNYGLYPLQDDDAKQSDDDVIESELYVRDILDRVKIWLGWAKDRARQAYIKLITAVGLGQHQDDEVD